ncbi:MAG: hypothetical protein IJS63_09360 [Bacteroidaceae bacterium]|nr:hypothetical protein [Bacteroidaceae bacterium]
MKTYVITLSQVFPSTHPRAGEPTSFKIKMLSARHNVPCYIAKFHTIRANYDFWRKRFEKIAAGEACLSIRQWAGKPYRCKQIEMVRLTREDGIGIQKLEFEHGDIARPVIDGVSKSLSSSLAFNDGLSYEDWKDWFKGYMLDRPLVIIHFTKFRY